MTILNKVLRSISFCVLTYLLLYGYNLCFEFLFNWFNQPRFSGEIANILFILFVGIASLWLLLLVTSVSLGIVSTIMSQNKNVAKIITYSLLLLNVVGQFLIYWKYQNTLVKIVFIFMLLVTHYSLRKSTHYAFHGGR